MSYALGLHEQRAPETAPPPDQREGAVRDEGRRQARAEELRDPVRVHLVCAILAWLSPVFLRWEQRPERHPQSSIYGIMAVG